MATTAIPQTKISGGSFLLEERQPDEVFTPEDFTEQHILIGQTAEEFAVNEIVPNIEKMEHKDFSITRDLLKKAGELGLSSARDSRSLRRPRDGQSHRRRHRRPHREVRRLRDHLGRDTPASARCPSFTSEPKSRKRNTCRAWRPAKSLALTLCRKLHPAPTH